MLIQADPDELANSAQAITNAASAADNICDRANNVSGAVEAAGRGDVVESMNRFVSVWTYGLSCMSQDGHNLAKMLNTAGAKYLESERAIIEATSA